MAIVCKSPSELDKMRASGRIVRQVLDTVRAMVKPSSGHFRVASTPILDPYLGRRLA